MRFSVRPFIFSAHFWARHHWLADVCRAPSRGRPPELALGCSWLFGYCSAGLWGVCPLARALAPVGSRALFHATRLLWTFLGLEAISISLAKSTHSSARAVTILVMGASDLSWPARVTHCIRNAESQNPFKQMDVPHPWVSAPRWDAWARTFAGPAGISRPRN